MAVNNCEQCGFVGPEFPADDLMREIHRGLHELGGRFLEVLDFIVGRAVPVKPLADLDGFDVDRNKAVFRGEVPPGGRIVGVGLVPIGEVPPAGGVIGFVEQEVVGEPLTPWQRDVLRRWSR